VTRLSPPFGCTFFRPELFCSGGDDPDRQASPFPFSSFSWTLWTSPIFLDLRCSQKNSVTLSSPFPLAFNRRFFYVLSCCSSLLKQDQFFFFAVCKRQIRSTTCLFGKILIPSFFFFCPYESCLRSMTCRPPLAPPSRKVCGFSGN